MMRWTGLAPWEFEFPFPGSLISTFLAGAEETAGAGAGGGDKSEAKIKTPAELEVLITSPFSLFKRPLYA